MPKLDIKIGFFSKIIFSSFVLQNILESLSIGIHRRKTLLGFSRRFPFFSISRDSFRFHLIPHFAQTQIFFLSILFNLFELLLTLGTFPIVQVSFLFSQFFLIFFFGPFEELSALLENFLNITIHYFLGG